MAKEKLITEEEIIRKKRMTTRMSVLFIILIFVMIGLIIFGVIKLINL